MLLILDVDYTLNQFYPPSLPDIAPAGLIEQSGPPMWEWITQHLTEVEYPVWDKAVETVDWLHQCRPTVIVSTGRPEALRCVTDRWLRQYFRFDTLLMRQPDDYRPNAEIKQAALQDSILPRAGEKQVYAFGTTSRNRAALPSLQRSPGSQGSQNQVVMPAPQFCVYQTRSN